jgi:hypothetical protein
VSQGVPLYDGRTFIGSITPDPVGISAKDARGRKLGTFKITAEAVRAVFKNYRAPARKMKATP